MYADLKQLGSLKDKKVMAEFNKRQKELNAPVLLRSVTYCCHQIVFVSRFFGIFLEFFALTTSCRFARAYRSRTNLITKHSSLDLFYQ